MTSLRHLDDHIPTDLNAFARHTGWLHGAVLSNATYGLVLFVGGLLLPALLTALTGWLRRPPGVRRAFPAPALEPAPGRPRSAAGVSAA